MGLFRCCSLSHHLLLLLWSPVVLEGLLLLSPLAVGFILTPGTVHASVAHGLGRHLVSRAGAGEEPRWDLTRSPIEILGITQGTHNQGQKEAAR